MKSKSLALIGLIAVSTIALLAQPKRSDLPQPDGSTVFEVNRNEVRVPVMTITTNGMLFVDKMTVKEAVRVLIAEGHVCAEVGHQWHEVPHLTLEYRSDGEYPRHRKCSLCGLSQTKETGNWK